MIFKFLCFSFCMLSATSFAIDQEESKKQQMLGDLEIIKRFFVVNYALKEWKERHFGWDLEVQIQHAKESILKKKHISIKEYQRIVKKLFNSACDYHVNVGFYSTESAELPFCVSGTNGRYFINLLKDDIFSETGELIPLEKGDELLYFDSEPTEKAVRNLKYKELGDYASDTHQKLAEGILTHRVGSLGHEVPHGTLSIVVNHVRIGQTKTYQLNWDYKPKMITHARQPSFDEKSSDFFDVYGARLCSEDLDWLRLCQTDVCRRLSQIRNGAPSADRELSSLRFGFVSQSPNLQNITAHSIGFANELLGAVDSEIPSIGEIIWNPRQNSDFHAYLALTPSKQRIAFIRIPDYHGLSEDVDKFEFIIEHFEENSDLLIIDQRNNPGGNILYMYALLSRLSPKPLKTLSHSLMITQKDVSNSHKMIDFLFDGKNDVTTRRLFANRPIMSFGYPIDYKFVQDMTKECQFIVQEWQNGRCLTNPFHCYGIEWIQPHPFVQYTKPIIVLVNSLDFSCAELFPAILQDNKRAIIFGSKTAGAGGYTRFRTFPNRFAIEEISITGSLVYRLDGNLIENFGVTPDIFCEPNERDYQDNYVDYLKALQQAIDEFFEKNNSSSDREKSN